MAYMLRMKCYIRWRPRYAFFMMLLIKSFPYVNNSMVGVSDIMKTIISNWTWNRITFITVNGQDLLTDDVIRRIFELKKGASYMRRMKCNIRIENQYNMEPNLREAKDAHQVVSEWSPSIPPIMKQAGFTVNFSWLLLLGANQTLNEVKSSLVEVPLYVDSEVVILKYDLEDQKWQLIEIWKVGPRTTEVLENLLGTWKIGVGLKMKSLGSKYHRRRDLKGYLFRVGSRTTFPYVSVLAESTLQNLESGYAADIWHTLQKYLNFTYMAKSASHGSLAKDGVTWSGMMGMLQSDEADIAIASFSITKIRSTTADFTIPTQIVSSRLYIKRPTLEATWTLYILPFDFNMWICLPFFVVVTGLWIWALNKVAIKEAIDTYEIRASTAFWTMFSGLVQQSMTVEPNALSTKITLVVNSLISLLIFTSYSAVLVSILATMTPRLPFEDFADLRNRPDWNLGVRSNTVTSDLLRLSPPDSPMRDAWETNVLRDTTGNFYSDYKTGLRNVLKGRYAALINKEIARNLLLTEFVPEEAQQIVDTNTDFAERPIGFPLQKRSPFLNIINYYLKKMTVRGTLNRLKRKWWPDISREPETKYPTIGLNEVFTLFVALGSGFLLSLTCLALELYGTRCLEQNCLP